MRGNDLRGGTKSDCSKETTFREPKRRAHGVIRPCARSQATTFREAKRRTWVLTLATKRNNGNCDRLVKSSMVLGAPRHHLNAQIVMSAYPMPVASHVDHKSDSALPPYDAGVRWSSFEERQLRAALVGPQRDPLCWFPADAQDEKAQVSPDSQDTAGYPLFPMDRPAAEPTTSEDRQPVHYPAIGWSILTPPAMAGGKLPASTILDVYVGLLYELHQQGYPDDGEIHFTRYDLLHRIGWVISGYTKHGRYAIRPSGRHYRDLRTALLYLSWTLFHRVIPGDGSDGGQAVQRAEEWFQILARVRLAKSAPGRKSRSAAAPVTERPSSVTFSPDFMRLVARGARTIPVDLGVYLSLKAGTPRQLYRLLTLLRMEGRDEIGVEELFARLGSSQSDFVPCRVSGLLGKAHREFVAKTLLRSEPEVVRRRGEYVVRYEYGDPRLLASESELLVWQASRYGVAEDEARKLAREERSQFERVLAAATLGMLRPKKTLAAMIVHFTRTRALLDDTGYRLSPREGQPRLVIDREDLRYLEWVVGERERRLLARSKLDLVDVRRRLLERAVERDRRRESWVAEGLVEMRLNWASGVPGLDVYLPARRANLVG